MARTPRRRAPSNPFLRPRAANTHETGLEHALRLAVERVIREDGLSITYRRQHQLGRYRIDLWIPECHAALEADGERWHPTAADARREPRLAEKLKKSQLRDRTLREQGVRVFHLRGNALRRDAVGCVRWVFARLGLYGDEDSSRVL